MFERIVVMHHMLLIGQGQIGRHSTIPSFVPGKAGVRVAELALPPYGPDKPTRDVEKEPYQGHKEPHQHDDEVQRVAT